MDIFEPKFSPETSSDMTIETNTKSVNFGDGYDMDILNGLNPHRQVWNLRWQGLRDVYRDEIKEFYLSHINKTFIYKIPGENKEHKWRCKANSWASAGRTAYRSDFSFSIKETFL